MLSKACLVGPYQKKLEEIRKKSIKVFGIIDMSIIHRIGHIDISENIVLIVAAGEHRAETFKACEWAIAELKRTTPIWKLSLIHI